MFKKMMIIFAIVATVATGCWSSLTPQQQDNVVVSMAVEGWNNKGSAAVLKDHASKLSLIPEAERAGAIARYQQVWHWLDAVQAAQKAAAARAAANVGGDCYAAARKHFPQSQWNKAYQIINRESGGNPGAQNKRSSAAGCFQIVRGSWNHPGGVSFNAGRYNANANAAAARVMWNGSGWYCTCTWALTA